MLGSECEILPVGLALIFEPHTDDTVDGIVSLRGWERLLEDLNLLIDTTTAVPEALDTT